MIEHSSYLSVFTRSMVALLVVDIKIPNTLKFLLAGSLSLMLGPVVKLQEYDLFFLKEVGIGLLLGYLAKTALGLINVFIEMVSNSVGLQNQTFIGNVSDNQSINALIYYASLVFLLTCGVDYVAIFYLKASYDIPFSSDWIKLCLKMFKNAFYFGISLSVPLMIAGLIFNILCALLNRLVSQIPIFLIMQSLVILGVGYFIAPIISSKILFMQTFFIN